MTVPQCEYAVTYSGIDRDDADEKAKLGDLGYSTRCRVVGDEVLCVQGPSRVSTSAPWGGSEKPRLAEETTVPCLIRTDGRG